MDILYTYGGGHLLYKVFNGIAAFCNNDTYWQSFFIVPVIISLFWVGVLSAAKADIALFMKKWFIPSFLLMNFMIIPKTSLNIVDEVDPSFGADKVDNIPQGFVTIIGLNSLVSRALTQMIEDVYATSDLSRFTKSGFAFSSRLTQEARTVRIADPRIRENVKAWADQCIWLPYLKTNIMGKAESARNSDDLVSWVEENGHPSLGTYWRNEDGSETYRTCKVTAPLIREALAVEGQRGLAKLAGKMFGVAPKGVNANQFKPLMQEAWQMVSGAAKSANQQVQQMMVVNAQKEAFDDNAAKNKYPRLHPELVSMNAARALETQGMTGMMNSVVASVSMPLLQATLIALFSVIFFILLPFFFMPGGLKRLLKWTQVMAALQIWTVLSAILNAIALIWMDRSAETVLEGTTGFSIATTSGLADSAWFIATWAGGAQMLIPVLSWAIISGSEFGMTQLIGGMTSGLQSLSARFAGEAADGNVSMGNQSFFNETIASRSVAQQNHVGSSNFAGSLNTGSQTITNALNGQSFTAQNQSQLATNMSSNQALNASVANSARQAEQLMHSNARSFNAAVSDTTTNVMSLLEKRAQGVNLTEGMNTQDAANFNKALDDVQSSMESLKQHHNMNAQTAIRASVGLDSSKSLVGGAASKLLGVKGGVDMSRQAFNNEDLSKAMNSDEGKRLSDSISRLEQYSKTAGGQVINSTGRDTMKNLSNSFADVKTSSDAFSRSYTASQNWEKVKSFSDNHGFTVQSNENDPWLSHVSDKTGLNKADAADYLTNGNNAAHVAQMRNDFISGKREALESFVSGADHILTDQEISNWNGQVPTVNETGSEGRTLLEREVAKQGFMSHESIKEKYEGMGHSVDNAINNNDEKFTQGREDFQAEHQTHKNNFRRENNKTNVRRLASKSSDDFVSGSFTKELLGDSLAKKE
ncbi:MAG: conjugal transfer protein TraG N-terminal domain-containing protein [Simkaniaceae bacterium]|nr:conjugal transfer protein TraG N-terminal domain-containing protein [Simkaniaceae bacterium]